MIKNFTKYINGKPVRAVWDYDTSTPWYSSIDVIDIFVKPHSARRYWNTIKVRHPELSTFCKQLKLFARDNKQYLSEVINDDGIKKLLSILPRKYKKPLITYTGQCKYYVDVHSEKLDFTSKFSIHDGTDGDLTDKAIIIWPEGSLDNKERIKKGTWKVFISVTNSRGLTSTYPVTIVALEYLKTFKPTKEELISAITHRDGQVINLTPFNIQEYYDGDPRAYEKIDALCEYNKGIALFLEHAGDPQPRTLIVDLYRKWDTCRQINTTVRWKNYLSGVDHFEIVLATDESLSQIVEEDKNINKKASSYKFSNLLINQQYFWQITAICSEKCIKSKVFCFKTSGYLRMLEIDGLSNIRDDGGYITEFGEIKQGLLFRGSRLDDATPEGKETLRHKFSIKCDLDLRELNEGDPNVLGFEKYYRIPAPYYGSIILNDKFYETARQILSVFCDKENYPLYYHCAVGRDRTGTYSAIIAALLGADEERILRNYWTSIFSVSGALAIPVTVFEINFTSLIDGLKSMGGSSLKEDAEIYAHKIGITDEQINHLRNIMTGKEKI